MVFWLGILIGVLFACFTVKIGLYETWAFVFNVIISIYLAVFLGPIVANIVPAVGDMEYNNALGIIATAVGSFLILQGISYMFLTGRLSVSFPRIFDTLGSGFLGFLAGFLVWSFVGLLICITPISQNTFIKRIGFDSQFKQTNMSYISWWCNLVNRVVSSEGTERTAEQAIDGLFKDVEEKAQARTTMQVGLTKPKESAEPNQVETGAGKEQQLSPPPEANVEDL
jgi:hypothetical protein